MQRLRQAARDEKTKDVLSIYTKIQEQRPKFRGGVWGPLFVEVTVTDALAAKYIDRHIPFAHKFAYVCEKEEDSHTLLQLRQQNNWKFTILDASRNNPEEIKNPKRQADMNVLRKHGVAGWLDEVIQCPEVVRGALMQTTKLHLIAYATPESIAAISSSAAGAAASGGSGGGAVDWSHALARSATDTGGVRTLYTPDNLHSVRFSKYVGGDAGRSGSVQKLTAPRHFGPIDLSQRDSWDADLKEAQGKRAELAVVLADFDKKLTQQSTKLNQLINDRSALVSRKTERSRLQGRINTTRENIAHDRRAAQEQVDETAVFNEIKKLNLIRFENARDFVTVIENWKQCIIRRDAEVLQATETKAARERSEIELKSIDKALASRDAEVKEGMSVRHMQHVITVLNTR